MHNYSNELLTKVYNRTIKENHFIKAKLVQEQVSNA